MFGKWLLQFTNASSKTKWFIFNWAIYAIVMIVTTLYCYARLNYVRSYTLSSQEQSQVSKP